MYPPKGFEQPEKARVTLGVISADQVWPFKVLTHEDAVVLKLNFLKLEEQYRIVTQKPSYEIMMHTGFLRYRFTTCVFCFVFFFFFFFFQNR